MYVSNNPNSLGPSPVGRFSAEQAFSPACGNSPLRHAGSTCRAHKRWLACVIVETSGQLPLQRPEPLAHRANARPDTLPVAYPSNASHLVVRCRSAERQAIVETTYFLSSLSMTKGNSVAFSLSRPHGRDGHTGTPRGHTITRGSCRADCRPAPDPVAEGFVVPQGPGPYPPLADKPGRGCSEPGHAPGRTEQRS